MYLNCTITCYTGNVMVIARKKQEDESRPVNQAQFAVTPLRIKGWEIEDWITILEFAAVEREDYETTILSVGD